MTGGKSSVKMYFCFCQFVRYDLLPPYVNIKMWGFLKKKHILCCVLMIMRAGGKQEPYYAITLANLASAV